MVTMTTDHSVNRLASTLAQRLVSRGRVPRSLQLSAEHYLRMELTRSLRRMARVTSRNAEQMLVALRFPST